MRGERLIRTVLVGFLALPGFHAFIGLGRAQETGGGTPPQIPKAWEDDAVVAVSSGVNAADERLLQAIRSEDTAAVRTLLKSGVDPNTRDETGATALMHAAIYASADCMRLLMDHGADVNAANGNGSTALMWASGDVVKVRALLDHGAAIGARTKDGTTALLVAARYGNIEAMRLLMARGGAPAAAEKGAIDLLRVAYFRDDRAMRRVLAEAGIVLEDAARLGPQLLNQNLTNAATTRELLDLGANPRTQVTFFTLSAPALGLAANRGARETVRLLIDRGADPNAGGSSGVTPLMMAAAADRPDKAIAQLLIQKGADLRARDQSGRTALDWAVLHGETAVVKSLRDAGAPATSPGSGLTAAAEPRTASVAIEQAVARLQATGRQSYERTKCTSCHHHDLPAIAATLAEARGLRVDRAFAAHQTQLTLDQWRHEREDLSLARNGGAFVAGTVYGLFGLSEVGVAPNAATDVATLRLASLQEPNGSWDPSTVALRPPLDGSPISITGLAIRALAVYSPPGRRRELQARIARARDFLRAETPDNTEDEAFKLLGFVWSEAAAGERSRQSKRLLALQREDGGWGQWPTMAPDAYATGQALYALHASGLSPTSAAYQKGAEYLLRTQLVDGTWFVRSRGIGFRPYFETGFPHGRDQFISAAATSWAAIALAYTLE